MTDDPSIPSTAEPQPDPAVENPPPPDQGPSDPGASASESSPTQTAEDQSGQTEDVSSPRVQKTRIGSQRYPTDMKSCGARSDKPPLAQAGKLPQELKTSAASAEDAPHEPDQFSYAGFTSSPSDKPAHAIPETTEDELQAALAGVSMEELLAGDASSAGAGQELEREERVQGEVVRMHRDDVFFTLHAPGKGNVRHQGVASLRQFEQAPEIGAKMEVVIARLDSVEGLYEVSIPGQAVAVADWSDIDEGAVVEARVTGSNKGGLECMAGAIRGFIPASQISLYRVEDFEEYHEQKFPCLVTEADPGKRNLVLSRRAILEREREQARKELLESLEVGQIRDGTVRKVMEFGAFVDLGGVDGLVHVSKLSWDRVENPRDVVQEGQPLKVRVESVDKQTGKISLSYRDVLEDPWSNIEQKYPVGAAAPGVVTKLMTFGAFVKLEPGVEGLIHISELAHHRVHQVGNVVSIGQQVDVKVLSVDKEKQRIGLSLKALETPPEKEETPNETLGPTDELENEDEPLREPAVRKRQGPLKGGRDRGAGGDKFGLNW